MGYIADGAATRTASIPHKGANIALEEEAQVESLPSDVLAVLVVADRVDAVDVPRQLLRNVIAADKSEVSAVRKSADAVVVLRGEDGIGEAED